MRVLRVSCGIDADFAEAWPRATIKLGAVGACGQYSAQLPVGDGAALSGAGQYSSIYARHRGGRQNRALLGACAGIWAGGRVRGVRGLGRVGFDCATILRRYCRFSCRIRRGVSDFHHAFLGPRGECFATERADGLGVGSAIRRGNEERVALASPDRGTRVRPSAGAFDARSRSAKRIWRRIARA